MKRWHLPVQMIPYPLRTASERSEKGALVPGIAFEVEDSGYVRLSYCCDYNVLKEGIRRIQNFRNIL